MYVDDKPVCDDGWDDTDANVVCKELGFSSGGYSTKESYFGKVDLERQSGFDEVRCSGRESSLVDCRHESFDDCGDGEGAGVVCYQDEEDYYEEEVRTLSSGSPSASVPLTSAGDLVMADNSTYQAGEFCLAGVFQGEEEWDKEVQEGEAVAVMCEPCKSEVGSNNKTHFQISVCRSCVLFCSLTSWIISQGMRLKKMKGECLPSFYNLSHFHCLENLVQTM